eukprot:GILK01004196.1.p1 GENE.GILK01004196.1~~GILK01004196.1.p1  ORF type:complete len:232 (-),score=29.09 GILK01004196.1:43-696(-)
MADFVETLKREDFPGLVACFSSAFALFFFCLGVGVTHVESCELNLPIFSICLSTALVGAVAYSSAYHVTKLLKHCYVLTAVMIGVNVTAMSVMTRLQALHGGLECAIFGVVLLLLCQSAFMYTVDKRLEIMDSNGGTAGPKSPRHYSPPFDSSDNYVSLAAEYNNPQPQHKASVPAKSYFAEPAPMIATADLLATDDTLEPRPANTETQSISSLLNL